MMSQLRRKSVSKKTVVLLVIVMILLIGGVIKIASASFLASDSSAYLTIVTGKVLLSDGTNEIDAKNGKIFARDVRVVLKTGEGIAKLQLRDGSYVILDANTTIELNRQKEINPENFFVFNLIEGKVMVIGEKGSRKPVQFLIQNNVVVRGFVATLGAKITEGQEPQVSIDCMVGYCQINGTHLILSGQRAEIQPDNTLLILDNASFTDWISLGKASGFIIDQPQNQAQFTLTSIPMLFLTIMPVEGYPGIPITGDSLSTPSPSLTTSVLLTLTLTHTPTRTKTRYPLPTLTLIPTNTNRVVLSTSTPQPIFTLLPSNTWIPSGTFPPGTTPSPSSPATLNPTDTSTPQPFPTLTSTNEPTLTPVPLPTSTPNPSATPQPTNTPNSTATLRPTRTLKPTKTKEPAPTATIMDSPVPTDTLAPAPSDTPFP